MKTRVGKIDRFDVVHAYIQFCSDYHGGQFSPEYKRLCKMMHYTNNLIDHEMSEDATALYEALQAEHRAARYVKGAKK